MNNNTLKLLFAFIYMFANSAFACELDVCGFATVLSKARYQTNFIHRANITNLLSDRVFIDKPKISSVKAHKVEGFTGDEGIRLMITYLNSPEEGKEDSAFPTRWYKTGYTEASGEIDQPFTPRSEAPEGTFSIEGLLVVPFEEAKIAAEMFITAVVKGDSPTDETVQMELNSFVIESTDGETATYTFDYTIENADPMQIAVSAESGKARDAAYGVITRSLR